MKTRGSSGAPEGRARIEVEDSNQENRFFDYAMALLSLIGAGAVLYYGQPLTLEFDSADFNPLLIVLVGLLVSAFFNLYKGVRRTIHQRLYGSSTLVLEAPPQLGMALVGSIRTVLTLKAEHKVRYRLRCVERCVRKTVGASASDYIDEVRWESREVREGVAGEGGGIPVKMQLPIEAMATQNDPRARGEVRWFLEVAIEGTHYAAAFGFRVLPAARVKAGKRARG